MTFVTARVIKSIGTFVGLSFVFHCAEIEHLLLCFVV